MAPQLQYVWEEGLALQSKNGWKMSTHNEYVTQTSQTEEAGGYSELLSNLLQNFINFSAVLRGKHKQRMQIKL